VIGFGGRATKSDQEPKYLNTPETAIFRKRETLYGLPGAIEPARRTDRLVVVEGYFDRIALARAGIAESVATCGTALSREHATQLRRRARQTVLLFDGDGAGQRAIVAALETLLPEGLRVLAAVLPEGDDPDTFLEREGPEALAALVEGARPALSIVLERAIARGIATPFARSDAAAMVAPLLARVVDGVERADWVRRVALAVGVDERQLALSVRAAAGGDDRESATAAASAVLASVSATLTPIDRALRSLVRLLLAHPALASRVCADAWHEALSENIHMKLVIAILDHVELGGEVTPGALVDRLDGDTRALLLTLAVDDAPHLEPVDAERVLDETLARLEMRRMRHEHRATTEQLRDVAAQDSSSLLREKQRQIERKRAVLGIGTATPVAP
jgi:DNA primase